MRYAVTRAQKISRMCFCCSVENTGGLHAQFLETDGGEVVVLFTPTELHQGYPGRSHG
ncbi:MAG: hypothetical protein N3B11_07360 [Coriobacteriia bacterium]|nr:hypothetical protein [Coriobacteriia bacterium]